MTEVLSPPGTETFPEGGPGSPARPQDGPLSFDGLRSGVDRLLDESDRLGLLTAEDEKKLAQRVHQGDDIAKEELILKNLRLIPIAVKKYIGRGMGFEDLFMEGYFGLQRAAELFEPSKRTRFSTYAVPAISRTVERAVANRARLIHIPLHVQDRQKELFMIERDLTAAGGAQPKLQDILERTDIPAEQAQEAWTAPHATLLLNSHVGEDKENELIDFVEDKGANIDPDAELTSEREAELKKALEKALDRLSGKHRAIIEMLFGLNGYPVYSRKEIGKALGISHKTVDSYYQQVAIDLYKDESLKQFMGLEEPDYDFALDQGFPVYIPAAKVPETLDLLDDTAEVEVTKFTFREVSIMAGIRDGIKFKDIAKRQKIGYSTLKSIAADKRPNTIYSKLGVASVQEAAEKLKETMPAAKPA